MLVCWRGGAANHQSDAQWLTDLRYASDVSVCWDVKSETQLSNSLRQRVQKVQLQSLEHKPEQTSTHIWQQMSQQRSEQCSQSLHTHKQSPASPHSSLLCRHALQGLQCRNPIGLPVKNTYADSKSPKTGANHCLGKRCPFPIRSLN